jgi:hypothetical protein
VDLSDHFYRLSAHLLALLFPPHSTDFDVELCAINYVHPVELPRTLHKLHDVPTGAVQISQNFPAEKKKLTIENHNGAVV